MPAYFASEPRDEGWASREEVRVRAALAEEGTDVLRIECKTTICSVAVRFSTAAAMERFLDHRFVDPEFGNGRGFTEVFDAATLEGVAYVTRVGCRFPNRRTGEQGACGAAATDPATRARNGLPPE